MMNEERKAEYTQHKNPLNLWNYLIKTYTNENEIVLDNTMGSGTTGLACLKTNRQFIGIEKENNITMLQCGGFLRIVANGIWLYAGGAKYYKTFNLHKRLLKARKFGLTTNPTCVKPMLAPVFVMSIMLGNLSVSQIEKRLGIEFPKKSVSL